VFTKIGLDYKQYIKTESVSPNLSEFKGDASRLKTLGWIPQYTFEDTMDEIIEHYNNIK